MFESKADEAVELTILMPCLNEAETIGICVEKAKGYLERSKVVGEILVADNGSTDGSIEIAEQLGARIVRVPVRGYGSALQHGIEQAHGKFVVMGDSDDSYDFSRLDLFVAKLRGGFDLVMGNRFQGGIADRAMPPLHRYFGNPVLSFIGRTLFSMHLGDFYCGLRGFRRDAIRNLHLISSGMEFALEMVVRSGLAQLKIAEVPTTLSPDGRSRPPHLRTWRDGWRSIRFFLLFSPRWLFLYPGFVLLGIGLVAAALLSLGPFWIGPHVELDLHTLLVTSMASIVGLQCITFAVIARRYAGARGFLPRSAWLEKSAPLFKLEFLLLIALSVGLAGILGFAWCILQWAKLDFGPMPYGLVMRILIISLTMIVVALQMTFATFLGALLDIPTRQ